MPAGWYPEPGGQRAERYWDGQQWTPATRARPRAEQGVGLLGILATLLGVVATVIGFTAVNWLDYGLGEPGDTFTMHRLGSDETVPAFARAYCSWLGWLLLALAAATALAACIPNRNRLAWWVGAVVANLLTLALTAVAISVLVHDSVNAAGGSVIGAGIWLSVGGFAATFAGAAAARVSV
jgi:hypothetical protein